jgi:rubrerythrin
MQSETIESILKKAANKEQGSYLIYKNVASRAKDVQIKTTLSKFAEEELKHKQAIEDFNIETLSNKEIEIEEASRQGISEYLTSTDDGISEDSDFNDILVYAAKREKKAFEFYSNMSKQVDDAELKKLFVWLAQEESKHKEDIEALFWEVIYR